MGRIEGKIAAITGGASGIGEAVVRMFVAEGALVGFSDMDEERGRAIEAELNANHRTVLFFPARMELEADAIGFVEKVIETFGGIDILVNNAGMRSYQKITETTNDSWDRILGVNVKGYAFCAKAAVSFMQKVGRGSIVNVSSNRSVVSGSNTVEYDTTKAAVVGMSRSIAYDHAKDGIRCNSVSPGPTFTRFHEVRAAALGKSVEEFTGAFGAGSMLKRPAHPKEVASCILFLASDESSYVTGANLLVDGGLHAVDADSLTGFLHFGVNAK